MRRIITIFISLFMMFGAFAGIANATGGGGTNGAGSGSACAHRPAQWNVDRLLVHRTPNQAAAFAQAHVGQSGWNCWCELFAETAYGHHAYNSAMDHFNTDRAHGRMHYWVAPRGAFVFFVGSDRRVGHVEIALGHGKYVTTDGKIRIVNLQWGGKYLGWDTNPFPG